ncbi:hypothetical protein BO79DRAFT_68886 [Aspergillus costaricaensis CBS 115574]|uniref:Uncharacterized protein n=1 Tax=Aspergillus costaricaensis CBS 115574 TaxID=1448317 RepID=A0ACD1I0J6_9EURO|nr:hypothetical protein BO79DRAFT_68886 [Aspergillus costaricaensis CBS 115574]RAK83318.1 hypothetical protein BO79DRAFT_68886 [Aspergillus costaricaensis CBS 115574]
MTGLTSMAGRRATKHCYGVSHCFCLLYIELHGGCRRGGLFFFFFHLPFFPLIVRRVVPHTALAASIHGYIEIHSLHIQLK